MANYSKLMEQILRSKSSSDFYVSEAKKKDKPAEKPTDTRDAPPPPDLPDEDTADPNIATTDKDKKDGKKNDKKGKGSGTADNPADLPGERDNTTGPIDADVADMASRFQDALRGAGIEDDGEDDNEVGFPEEHDNLPVPLEDMPAVIGRATGNSPTIKWKELRKTPGYNMYTRGLTKQYFETSLDEKVSKLEVATNVDGSSKLAELRNYINYLEAYGVRVDEFEHELPAIADMFGEQGIPPEMAAHYIVKVYHADGNAFLVMREDKMMGGSHMYIYAARGKGTQSRQQVGQNAPKQIGRNR